MVLTEKNLLNQPTSIQWPEEIVSISSSTSLYKVLHCKHGIFFVYRNADKWEEVRLFQGQRKTVQVPNWQRKGDSGLG